MGRPTVPTETPEQAAAWDQAFAESRAELEGLASQVAADLAEVPADADDEQW